MSKPLPAWLKLAGVLFLVTAFEAINQHFVYSGLMAGWFPTLYFPLMLGVTFFGITIYFLTDGVLWQRLYITFFGALILTWVWFITFVVATVIITGVGGELVGIRPP